MTSNRLAQRLEVYQRDISQKTDQAQVRGAAPHVGHLREGSGALDVEGTADLRPWQQPAESLLGAPHGHAADLMGGHRV